MDDEFKLCWKNFQDNIASGFQNLYDRGDLVDVTLACDGKLLHAHKIVLAICSPYFQEIFITNPCKHPIIILKDVTFNIMCELLEFMYQGVVNVKHTELQTFMKIGQLLQIKGLATNTSSSAASSSSEKSVNQTHNNDEGGGALGSDVGKSGSNTKARTGEDEDGNTEHCSTSKTNPDGNTSTVRSHTPTPSPSPMSFAGSTLNQTNLKSSPESSSAPLHHTYNAGVGHKRHSDFGSDTQSIYARKQFRRSAATTEHNSDHNDGADGNNSMDQVNPEDFFLSNIPHISMIESRYDLSSVKRESEHHGAASSSAAALRNSFGAAFSFDYNMYKSNSSSSSNTGAPVGPGSGIGVMGGPEYPNDLHMPNDYSKNFGNHMDIPAITPGEHWWQGKLEFMLSQRGKPLLVHDGHTFGIQYVRKDKKYWQCNLSRKFNCKARVTTTDTGEIIVTNNEHCHTEIRQHLRKDYQRNKVMMNALINLSTNRLAENMRRHANANVTLTNLGSLQSIVSQNVARASSVDASIDQSGILDLGKAASSSSSSTTPVPLIPYGISASIPSDDNGVAPPAKAFASFEAESSDEGPLDCGIRTASNIEDPPKNTHEPFRQAQRHTSEGDCEWKCKDEKSNSQ